MKTLLLIDAHAFIHRAFHALPPMTSPQGNPVNAIYGLTNTLMKTLQSERPDYVAACFDRPESTFRKKEYAEYKAHRPELADGLISQLNEARNFFEAFKVPVLDKAGYEADDIIGTLAQTAKKKGLRVVILTGDQDTLQLVSDGKILVRTPKKGISEMITYDEAGVVAKLGVRPEQVIDYKGLCGDASDNIPGVPGVGPKTAQKLLAQYGTLESLYEALKSKIKITGQNLKGKNAKEGGSLTSLEEKLLNYEKEARLSKKLATIDTEVPVKIDFDELHFQNGTHPETLEYLRKMGFQSILQRLQNTGNQELGSRNYESRRKTPTNSGQGGLFVSTQESQVPRQSKGYGHLPKDVMMLADKLELSDKLFDKKITKIAYDVKELVRESQLQDSLEVSPIFDLHVAAWLLNPDIRDWSPEILEAKYFDLQNQNLKIKSQNDNAKLKIEQSELGSEKTQTRHLSVELFLYKKLKEEVKKTGLEKVLYKIEMPLIDVLAKMERWGIQISEGVLTKLSKEIDSDIAHETKEIEKLAGVSFNLNSPKQVAEVLFDRLGLTTGKRSKTPGGERSTAEKVLAELKDKHPIIPLLLQHREDSKIRSTYITPLLELAKEGNTIHTRFVQTGTATGRISSEKPNLQNIPQESRWSKRIREAFHARDGFSFLSFDYSQLELRLLAHLSKDKTMTKAFLEGQDIHKMTAATIFKVSESAVTPQMRRLAKVLNFGVIYGMGPRRVAAETGSTMEEAKDFIAQYFRSYDGVSRYQNAVIEEARNNGIVRNENGRLRLFPSIASGHQRYAAESERQAINFPIQSLEADVLKRAMIETAYYLKREKIYGGEIRPLLTIHDELLFEVRDGLLESITPKLKKIMEEGFDFDVPLKVEHKSGKSWGTMS